VRRRERDRTLSSATRRCAQGWKFATPATRTGKRVLVVGAGPSGLSAAYQLARAGHAVTIMEAGPLAGGMMRFGIPKYRLPRAVLDAEIQRIVDLGVVLQLNSKVTDVLATMREGAFDAVFLAVGAHIAKRAYLPAGSAGKMLDAVAVLRSMEGEERPLLGRRVVVYGGGQHGARRGADGQATRRRGIGDRLPTHARKDARPRCRTRRGIAGRRAGEVALDDREAGESSITVEKMTLDDKGMAQPTGEFETLEADSVVLALGQDVDLALLDGVPGLEIDGGVVKVDEQHDDWARRHFCRRRHGAGRAHGDRRHRPRQAGRAQHRRLAARRRPGASGRATSSRRTTSSIPGTTRTRRSRSGPCSTWCGGSRPSRRSSVVSMRRLRSSRHDAA
jgi:NADPH-dependent glutamate synthase beta subunit-like oxidoreductase